MSLLLALAVAAAAPPAKADALSVQMLHDFSACVARSKPAESRAVLAMDYREDGYLERLKALATDENGCLWPGSQLQFSPVLFAGALAEIVLESESGAALGARLANDPTRPPIEARSDSETMALCTVIEAPQAAVDLLASTPASAEEKRAMSAIVAVLPDCLKKDMQVTLNPPALRALVALAALRIAGHSAGGAQ